LSYLTLHLMFEKEIEQYENVRKEYQQKVADSSERICIMCGKILLFKLLKSFVATNFTNYCCASQFV